jgi:IS30 family transposase
MEKTIENIFILRDKGFTYTQIAEELGYSKSTISHHLGDGQKAKTKNRQDYGRAKIEEFIQLTKTNNPCHDCNQFFHYCVMQYDHLPQFEKLFNIARWHDHTRDIYVVIEEMNKCELVCANCHALRGWLRRQDAKGMLLDEEY